jgi:UDP-N-acetyl-D-glucosamine dehydrogenase
VSHPSPALTALRARLDRGEATVAIVGLGYVGLPLAMAFVDAGLSVVGVDVSAPLCAGLRAGRSHIDDIADATVAAARATGRFDATTDPAVMAGADAVVICVPTPLRKTKDPDISYIVAASEAVSAHARPGQLVVLESTTYPGTTEEVVLPMLADKGLTVGEDIALAFSPERVDPANPRFGIRNTPKVVGGVTAACTDIAAALYGRCCDTVVPVSTPATAEMVKLLENVFRSVNIGLVNEFALICRQLDLDIWEVIDAASTKPFGFMRFVPGPGLGGHCIPVDPHYLAWKLRGQNHPARFIELADAINSRMPAHVVDIVTDALNEDAKAVRGSRILLLGVAYKPDISDVRESPALEVISLLAARGARLRYHDPHVPSVSLPDLALHSEPLTADALEAADCVVILTHHTDLDRRLVLRHAGVVVDTRNALGGVPVDAARARVHRL